MPFESITRRFVLEPEQWELFVAALDRPPRSNRGLATLFSQPSVFTLE